VQCGDGLADERLPEYEYVSLLSSRMNVGLTNGSCNHDGGTRDRRAILTSEAFLDKGSTEFTVSVCDDCDGGVWLDGCCWIIGSLALGQHVNAKLVDIVQYVNLVHIAQSRPPRCVFEHSRFACRICHVRALCEHEN
jgi:hypothetical protein